MPTVELVYESACPFIRNSPRRLIEAFQKAGISPRWTEWEISDPQAPERVRQSGSPTVLNNGCDIVCAPQNTDERCCRIYAHGDDPPGVPPLQMTITALTASRNVTSDKHGGGRINVHYHAALLPAVGLAVLPKLTCPACWPAYAGLLSSFGTGFTNYTPYLMPLTASFLFVSVLALAYRAKHRHGYGPCLLGAFSALAILVGKFGYDNDPSLWVGLGVLVFASIWNSLPRRIMNNRGPKTECAACAD